MNDNRLFAVAVILTTSCATIEAPPYPGAIGPQLVISAYSNWEAFENDTEFVLYSDGRALSRLNATLSGAPFSELQLTKEERAGLVNDSRLAKLNAMREYYNESTVDADRWVIQSWEKDKLVLRVQANVSMSCINGQLKARNGFGELPVEFKTIVADACAVRDSGRGWVPVEFRLQWSRANDRKQKLIRSGGACMWPSHWQRFGPKEGDLISPGDVTTKVSGERFVEVAAFLRECASGEKVVVINGIGVNVSIRFELPGEGKWWHLSDD